MGKKKKIKDIIGFEPQKEENLIDISEELMKETKKIQDFLKEDNND